MVSESPHAHLLRRLALNDVGAVDDAMRGTTAEGCDRDLGERAQVFVRLAALIATEATAASYQWAVASAFAVGATEGELVDVLLTVAPIVGVARVASAASPLAAALGFDIDVLNDH